MGMMLATILAHIENSILLQHKGGLCTVTYISIVVLLVEVVNK